MRTVWKYPISEVENYIKVGEGARVVLIAEQQGKLCVWVEHTVERSTIPSREMKLILVGTGQDVPEEAVAHIGSVLVGGGAFVFHLYEGA